MTLTEQQLSVLARIADTGDPWASARGSAQELRGRLVTIHSLQRVGLLDGDAHVTDAGRDRLGRTDPHTGKSQAPFSGPLSAP